MDIPLLSTIIIALVIVCLFGMGANSPLMNYTKTIEEMNTQELITDFNLLLESQKAAKEQEKFNPSAFQLTSEPGMVQQPKGWDIYTQSPFYFMKTNPNKPVFYEKPLYRKPYRFPFGYMSSYPFNHFSHFQN
jgi:hypothetical protein